MDSSSSDGRPAISLRGVHVLYGRIMALDIERLTIASGERVFVLGCSGSGKTTLSRMIKARVRPSAGKLSVLGIDPCALGRASRSAYERCIAMIDQEFHLVPRLSVMDNLMTGALGRVPVAASLLGWYPLAELERAEAILAEVDLEGLEGRRVDTLSGGQRQRVAIARALMQNAEIIVADEPVSNLDPELAEDALELLVDCVARRGVTLLVNLHQPDLARRFASRIVGLSAGRVVYDGPPEAFGDKQTEFLYRAEAPDFKVIRAVKRGEAGAEPA